MAGFLLCHSGPEVEAEAGECSAQEVFPYLRSHAIGPYMSPVIEEDWE